MKTRKTVLFSIYAFLILLYLLLCLRCCCHREEEVPLPDAPPAYTGGTDLENRAREIGHDGRLKITLLWDFPGDIDLHVREPNGFEIYFNQKRDRRTGGYLDIDNTVGGHGSAENVYWETPPSGNYKVSLVYFAAAPSHLTGGPCTVIVKREINGEPHTESFRVNMTTVNRNRRVPVTEFTLY